MRERSPNSLQVVSSRLNIMCHSKVDITRFHQVRIKLDNVQNVFTRKGITSQTLFNFGQNFQVHRVGSIQKIHESAVFVSETVEKVLSKDPTDITVNGFLDCFCLLVLLEKLAGTGEKETEKILRTREFASLEETLKRSSGKTVNQTGFFHNLINGMFNGLRLAVRELVEIEADDGDTIGELF
jgi:hypothetical protein